MTTKSSISVNPVLRIILPFQFYAQKGFSKDAIWPKFPNLTAMNTPVCIKVMIGEFRPNFKFYFIFYHAGMIRIDSS